MYLTHYATGQSECITPVNVFQCGINANDRGLNTSIETRLITGMEFPCNGTIVGWRVAGIVGQGTQYPKLQVWRRRGTTEEYYKPGRDISMEGLVSSTPVNCTIFEHSLDEAAQVCVQTGDILGIELPPGNDQAFDILYALGGGPQNYIYRQRLPTSVNLTNSSILFGISNNQPLLDLRVVPGTCTYR